MRFPGERGLGHQVRRVGGVDDGANGLEELVVVRGAELLGHTEEQMRLDDSRSKRTKIRISYILMFS